MTDSRKTDLMKAAVSPHGRPWLAVAGQVPATFLANAAWSDSAAAAIGMTVASGLLTAATWWGAAGTSPARRIHATITTGAATTYLTVATFADPLGGTELSVLAIGGATLAASWNIRKAMRVQVDGTAGANAASETGLLTKSIGKAKLALRGEPKVEPNKVTAPYKITAPGELTNAEIGRRLEHIATELGISPNAIRLRADGDDASLGEFVFVPKDRLVDGEPYPGPSNMGASITEPIHVGIYEDGAPEIFWFPADPEAGRNATHFGAFGMNGSAKSTGMTFAIMEVLSRDDAIVWATDPAKGMQTFGPLLPYLDWVEMTEVGGNAMIDALTQVITARADELGRHGFKNWTREAFEKLAMPYMVVWIEEAARFFRNGTEMEGLVMEARSAGISVIVSLQRPSATSMPTDVREQLGGVICFGVKGSSTADMALPDEVRDAGARPEAWENRKPGYNYLVAPGVDEERYPSPARTFTPVPDDTISAILAQTPQTPAGSTTINAAGSAYANRTIYTAGQALTSIDTKETVMTPSGQDDDALIEQQVARELMDDDGDTLDLNVDADQDIPPASATWSFGHKPQVEKGDSQEKALARLLAFLDELRQEGRETVGPKDFAPYGKGSKTGRSRAWVSESLGDLADAGIHLAETDKPGVYRLLHPAMSDVA
ncbi:conjugal transfer protein TraB [Streptomyces goshikiensis]|uniref:conjugal transfer protein TraB n=1 Tax=Streptomyces goshikiensis TaxID=1942 RepID=UPI002E10211C|nr:conjugal transfer protein TraB [Streptomyces goshikiensis]